MVSNIKVLKDNSNKVEVQEENTTLYPIKINCSQCASELEITEEDTHIGWLGARCITCPCCGEESIVEEIDGITLTKDNIEFPKHFMRTNKEMRRVKEIEPPAIEKEIKEGIDYFRENKDEWVWFTTYGDLFIVIFRNSEDEDYYITVTKDFYETYIPFEREDYE